MTDKDTLIEKYLYDELSETDVQEFEQRLDSNAEFADEVKLRSVIFAKNKSDFKQLLKTKQQQTASKPVSKVAKITPLYYLKRTAALLILGVLAFVLYRSIGGFELTGSVDTYLAQIHPDPMVIMGENDGIAAWKAATVAFQENSYAAAAYEIEKITSPTVEQQFYLGLAYLYQKDYDKSITQFEPVTQQKSIDYSPAARWYVSLAYLKNKQTKQAEKYLQQIVRDTSWKHKEARKLLTEL